MTSAAICLAALMDEPIRKHYHVGNWHISVDNDFRVKNIIKQADFDTQLLIFL